MPYSCALRAGASYNFLLVDGVRRLTPRELLRIQGFPEDYKIVVGYQAIRKQTGNSVPVSMIRAVAERIVYSLKEYDNPNRPVFQTSRTESRAVEYE